MRQSNEGVFDPEAMLGLHVPLYLLVDGHRDNATNHGRVYVRLGLRHVLGAKVERECT